MKQLQSQFDSPEASPGFLLWQLSNKWQAAQRKALATYELTHVQFVLLASLTWSAQDNPMTQKELAQHTQVDIMMTSQVLRALEAKGFVARTVSQQDQRAIHVAATTKGQKLANDAIKAVELVDERFFGKLGSELPQFIHHLQKLTFS
jgi:DNA-binding MarR family transcriptional regulator